MAGSLAAQVTSAGITAPSYADILASLQFSYQSIYGTDVVLDSSTQDGQLLAIFAQAIFDSNQLAVTIYNAFSPAFAQGAGLSSVVKINGLQRQAATASTVPVTLTGQAGTVINGGLVGDNQNLGTQWALPSTVTIPGAGTIQVTATCTVLGSTPAGANTITNILTPTVGWQTTTNGINTAALGTAIEGDAQLRQRQARSTSLPAETVTDGVYAAVANVFGVTEATIFENFTDVIDNNGLPPHSVAVVAFGGAAANIASAILLKKTPGCDTFGTTSQVAFDPLGVPKTISFFAGVKITITVNLTIKALTGYATTTGGLIAAALAAYLNSLDIGEASYYARLFGPATLNGDAATGSSGQTQAQLDALSATFNLLSITQSRAVATPETTIIGGPYGAGSGTVTVVSAKNIFQGTPLAIVLDNASQLNTTVTGVAANNVTFSPTVPGGRSILPGAAVYLTRDVTLKLFEQAQGVAANIILTVI